MDMPERYFLVVTNNEKGLSNEIKYDSYNDAFDRAIELRNKYGIFVYIYECSIVNHFAPLSQIENNQDV